MEPNASDAQTSGQPIIVDGLIVGADEFVAKWVIDRVGGVVPNEIGAAIGSFHNGQITGGVIYHEYRPDRMISMVAAGEPGWLNRGKLRKFFSYPFDELGVKRINAVVDAANERAIEFNTKLGFVVEGRVREAMNNDSDAIIFGMLKKECRWL